MTGVRVPLVLGTVLVAGFVLLGVLTDARPLPPDLAIARWWHGVWREQVGQVAEVVSAVLGPVLPVLLGCALLVSAGVLWRGGLRHRASLLLRLVAVLALSRATSWVFKPVFDRNRPKDYPDFSYPSGHVVSVASAGFVAVLLCAWLAPRLARRVLAVSAAAVVLSAACRMLLGVHWLSDTVGSVLGVLGVGLLACVALGLLPVLARSDTAARPGGVTSPE